MAVPNTTTFALSDVVTELSLTPPKSLGDCFTSASAGLFDPSYEGSKDRLSNFRNYNGGASVTAFTINSVGQASDACGLTPIVTKYLTGGNTTPNNGEVVYNDAGGFTAFDGDNKYFTDGTYNFLINKAGQISLISSCPTGVTTSAIFMTQTGQGTGNGACAQPSTFLRYLSGGDVTPSNGEVIYTDASPSSSPFNGGNLFYSDGSLSFQVSATGVISNIGLCTI